VVVDGCSSLIVIVSNIGCCMRYVVVVQVCKGFVVVCGYQRFRRRLGGRKC